MRNAAKPRSSTYLWQTGIRRTCTRADTASGRTIRRRSGPNFTETRSRMKRGITSCRARSEWLTIGSERMQTWSAFSLDSKRTRMTARSLSRERHKELTGRNWTTSSKGSRNSRREIEFLISKWMSSKDSQWTDSLIKRLLMLDKVLSSPLRIYTRRSSSLQMWNRCLTTLIGRHVLFIKRHSPVLSTQMTPTEGIEERTASLAISLSRLLKRSKMTKGVFSPLQSPLTKRHIPLIIFSDQTLSSWGSKALISMNRLSRKKRRMHILFKRIS